MKNKTNTVIIILLIVILVLLIYLSFKPKDVNAPLNKSQTFGEQVLQNSNQPTKLINTYTYTNHGFSIELPKGFVPNEEQSEGGPSTTISMPLNNMIVYVTNADFWERHNFSSIEEGNICEKGNIVIGNKSFKTCKDNYSNNPEFYWLRVGNIGYEIHGNKNDFKTFKFIGWQQTETKTNYGISISVPNGMNYSANVGDYGVFAGLKMIKVTNGNNIVIDITKEPNQVRFNEDAIRNVNEWILVDSNYSIGGVVGKYYRSKSGILDNGVSIVIPSKLIIISVSPSSFAGISQSELDKIISSITIK